MSERNLLLGITGSIAAKKSIQLLNLLKADYNIKIIVTYEGNNYIDESDYREFELYKSWDNDRKHSYHIELARWADEFVVYPSTANFISKVSVGLADDLLTSTILMYKNRPKIFPAMHEEMITNLSLIKSLNNLLNVADVYGPRYGLLDIGDSGIGRLLEPKEAFDVITRIQKENVFVISGPTKEYIDEVRFITNPSSGKQGYALALESHSRGYATNLITSIKYTNLNLIKQQNFETTNELLDIINSAELEEGYLFMPAAISDFIPEKYVGKLNRKEGDISIKLSPNIDIIKKIKSENPNLIITGFSAQLNNEHDYQKMLEKKIDFMVINNISNKDIGFESDNNQVTIIGNNGIIKEVELSNKFMIAKEILDHVIS